MCVSETVTTLPSEVCTRTVYHVAVSFWSLKASSDAIFIDAWSTAQAMNSLRHAVYEGAVPSNFGRPCLEAVSCDDDNIVHADCRGYQGCSAEEAFCGRGRLLGARVHSRPVTLRAP